MGKGKADKPGIYCYFSDWNPLLNLDDTSLARLFRAAIRYGQYGEVPELSGMEQILWQILAPKIDRDAERYLSRCESGEYAVFCREEKKAGRTPCSFSEWRNGQHRTITTDNDDIQLQQQTQLQTQTQQQTQLQTQLQRQRQEQGQGDRGEGEREERRDELYLEWRVAMESRELRKAGELSNRLYALGYNVDPVTRELKER